MMNDMELDELLNNWKPPAIPASLREGVCRAIPVRTALPERTTWGRWRLWLAAASVATFVIAILLSNRNAFTTPLIPPPFTVDSEIIRYDDGSLVEKGPKMLAIRSFNQDGSELILSWSSNDDSFGVFVWRLELAVRGAIETSTVNSA